MPDENDEWGESLSWLDLLNVKIDGWIRTTMILFVDFLFVYSFLFFFNFIDMSYAGKCRDAHRCAYCEWESKLKRYNYIRIYNIVISDFGISLLSRRDEKISLQGDPSNRAIFDSSLVCCGRKMFARWKLGQFCAFLYQCATFST